MRSTQSSRLGRAIWSDDEEVREMKLIAWQRLNDRHGPDHPHALGRLGEHRRVAAMRIVARQTALASLL